MDIVFGIAILIMSVVIHEVSHGYAALYYGDETAKYAGRLTLNPLKHLDPIGSVVVPVILILAHTPFLFGWARPVPVNERNLRNPRTARIVVAAAGVLINLFLALFFGIVIRLVILFGFGGPSFLYIASLIVIINIGLAVFNLIPIPPLDGSKILFGFLPFSFRPVITFLERYSLILVVVFMLLLWQVDFISPIISFLFKIATGISA